MKLPRYLLLSDGKKVGVYGRTGIAFEVGLPTTVDLPDEGLWRGKGGQKFEWFKLAVLL